VLAVLVISEAVGLPLLLAMALAQGESLPSAGALAWSIAAGVFGLIAVGTLYRALAHGNIAVAAPITGIIGAAIPVAFSVVVDGAPRATQIAGCALGLAGVWLVTRSGERGGGLAGAGLAAVAGVGFGVYFICFKQAGSESTFTPILIARTITFVGVLPLALLRGVLPQTDWRALSPLAAASGVLDTLANAAFVVASQSGRLALVAVLGSLYPAMTVLLARLVLRERTTRTQNIGLGVVVAAIACMVV
jgi:drug/metabolite transporter (DMT)-like permease